MCAVQAADTVKAQAVQLASSRSQVASATAAHKAAEQVSAMLCTNALIWWVVCHESRSLACPVTITASTAWHGTEWYGTAQHSAAQHSTARHRPMFTLMSVVDLSATAEAACICSAPMNRQQTYLITRSTVFQSCSQTSLSTCSD